MRTATSDLIALLSTRQFLQADLYSFTLQDGTVLRYTSYDVDLASGFDTFSSGVGFERTKAKWSVGLSVDTMDVTLSATPDQLVNGVPLIESIASGDWDGALAQVDRAFIPSPGAAITGSVIVFKGWIGDIDEIGRILCKMTLQGKLALLNVGIPKALFGPSCRHVLFDAGCALNRASFTTSGTVGAGSTASSIVSGISVADVIGPPLAPPTLSSVSGSGVNLPPATYFATITYTTALGETIASPEASLAISSTDHLLHIASPPSVTGATGWNAYVGLESGGEQLQNTSPIAIGTGYTIPGNGIYLSGQSPLVSQSNGYYSLGVITFMSGVNSGKKRVIEYNVGGTLTLRVPLPVAPNPGDTFTVTPGCDHTMATCASPKFSNLIHFGGEPFIPVPEAGSA